VVKAASNANLAAVVDQIDVAIIGGILVQDQPIYASRKRRVAGDNDLFDFVIHCVPHILGWIDDRCPYLFANTLRIEHLQLSPIGDENIVGLIERGGATLHLPGLTFPAT
jgi:hypothetical protein